MTSIYPYRHLDPTNNSESDLSVAACTCHCCCAIIRCSRALSTLTSRSHNTWSRVSAKELVEVTPDIHWLLLVINY